MTFSVDKTKLPKHVAIIPDGNRRWAHSRNLPTLRGHTKGFQAANAVIRQARDLGIHTFTLWAFSTENWNRSETEVNYLMRLYEENISKNLEEALKSEARIVHLGRKDRIPGGLQEILKEAEQKTAHFTKHILNIALDYGGHDEILRAVTKATKDIESGKLTPQELTQEVAKYKGKYPIYKFADYLDTAGQPYPYPDLIIRTSGEQRLSGYLSWQSAYSEFYFADVHMPDFKEAEFKKALIDFAGRERRFGGNAKSSGDAGGGGAAANGASKTASKKGN
ncbi:di-trans,poly-cis-decaprenylcistransferase [candidate division WWE3 bacterium]|nr:di-trans,poly-cis-decaprenylcistransferase [candidate division WWE3 bacterium]